ncbi:S8 family serine peptidase [Nonomuraea angiospora]
MILRMAVAAALLATATHPASATGGNVAQTDTTQTSTARENAVTLLTGDRVIVAGGGYRVEPGAGREVGFMRQVHGGHLYVIPSDALPLIAQGRLDRRLFDVTQLLSWHYGDADRNDLPLIVQGGGLRGAREERRVAGLGMTAVRVPKSGAVQTWKNLTGDARTTAATKIWLDGQRSFALDQSVKQIGAPQAWKQGMTGKGVTVAVLDSGYDPDHPDLKGVVTQSRNFSEDADVRDLSGHGTHVASIVASVDETYRGVAPDAKLAVAKVGGASGIFESAILAGMEWAAVEVKAKVVNMSLGAPDNPDLDPVEQALNTLSERTGALFVVAAGNTGAGPLLSPAGADAALAVGSVDRANRLAPFSSRGPRDGDHAIKPDVTAPGVGIVAAAPGGRHVARSGTSMAAPHVAGAAAILAQRHPDWTGQRLKAALIGSAAQQPGATLYEQGAGLVDLVRALAQPVTAEPGTLWASFPYGGQTSARKAANGEPTGTPAAGEQVATRTLTYVNSGDIPITLDLTAEGEVLKLSAERAEVPAGGSAPVTLTIDARGALTGEHPGVITARSGETVIRTPAGAYVEPESYDVTLNAVDAQGRPADPYAQVYDEATGAFRDVSFRDGTATLRLTKGKWNLFSETWESDRSTIAHTPLTVAADVKVVLDARKGKEVRTTIDDPAAKPIFGGFLYLANGPWELAWSTYRRSGGTYVVPVRQQGLHSAIRSVWQNRDVVYDVAARHDDGITQNPVYDTKRKDLAKVTATYRATGDTGSPLFAPRLGTGPAYTSSTDEMIKLPGTLTFYRTPGLVWDSGLEIDTHVLVDDGEAVRPGHTSETWNTAVAGPSLSQGGGSRTGDELVFAGGGLFADGVAGRAGTDVSATGTVTLAGDGKVLATSEITDCLIALPERCELRAELPAEAASYTLRTSMSRQSVLSTKVEAAWTFRSSRTAKRRPLPLMAVRYAPDGLDDANRARLGSLTRLPIWVERGRGAGPVKLLRLETSADDGATWHAVPVAESGSGWTALVRNPATPGFVSLRVMAQDGSGGGLTQTIVRAYAVGPAG